MRINCCLQLQSFQTKRLLCSGQTTKLHQKEGGIWSRQEMRLPLQCPSCFILTQICLVFMSKNHFLRFWLIFCQVTNSGAALNIEE